MFLARFVRFIVYSALFMAKLRTDRTYHGYLDLETQPTMDQTNLFYRKNQKESTATRKKKTLKGYMYREYGPYVVMVNWDSYMSIRFEVL